MSAYRKHSNLLQIGASTKFDLVSDLSVKKSLSEGRMNADEAAIGIMAFCDERDLELAASVAELLEAYGAADTHQHTGILVLARLREKIGRRCFRVDMTSRVPVLTRPLQVAEEIVVE